MDKLHRNSLWLFFLACVIVYVSYFTLMTALEIYRHFCDQTRDVVEYLAVAKKLQNVLEIPIPNLKHVSDRSFLLFFAQEFHALGTRVIGRRSAGVLERSKF